MNPQSPYNPGGQDPYQPQDQPPQPQPQGQPLPGQQTPYQQPQQYGQPQPQYPTPGQFPNQPQPTAPAGGYAPIPPAKIAVPRARQSKKWLIIACIFIFTTIVGLGLGGWSLYNYYTEKNNINSTVTSAVASAVKDEQDKAAAHLIEVENEPTRLFAGPEDYGNLSFKYSKLWSVYVEKDAAKGGTFAAYLNPVEVPPVSLSERYALRVLIEEKDYDQVVASYKKLVDGGDLTVSPLKLADGTTGSRLEGNFTKDIRGSAIIFKMRDKTVTLRTDADTFKPAFDALIATIQYNK